MSIVGGVVWDRPYIAMVQDGGETSDNGLERGEGVCGFLDKIDG